MTWHLDAEAVTRYGTGAARGAEAASAEAHLLRCAACRVAVSPYADPARLDAVLDSVGDVLDRPRTGPVERLLRAVRVPEPTARLLAATPALRASWLLSVLTVLAFAAVAADADDGIELFLVLAPVLPVLGVAVAYGRAVDPAYEVTVAAPFGGLRLVLLRAGTVLAATVAMTAATAVLLPGTRGLVAWLLPALALTAVTLALGTVWEPARAAAAVACGWLVATTFALRHGTDIAGSPTQLLCLLLLGAGAAVLALRRDRYEREVRA